MKDTAEVLDHLPDEVGVAEVGHVTGSIAARPSNKSEVRGDNENRMVSAGLNQPLDVANRIGQGSVWSYN
jgi:hypothetical protein